MKFKNSKNLFFTLFVLIGISGVDSAPLTEEQIKKAKKIAFIPGTFDPITTGHQYIANEVLKESDVDLVVFLPTVKPLHKKPLPVSERLDLIHSAFKDHPQIVYPYTDQIRSKYLESSLPADSRFVNYVKELNPAAETVAVIGEDVAGKKIASSVVRKIISPDEWIVLTRAGSNVPSDQLKKRFGNFTVLKDEGERSSSKLRKLLTRLKDNLTPSHYLESSELKELVSPEVFEEIYSKGLYGTQSSSSVDSKILDLEASPYRFLNGKKLANKMTSWILENTSKEERGRDHFIGDIRLHLYAGTQFRSKKNPKRNELYNWILSQPDNSILPDKLYEEAIKLEQGNIGKAMTLVWDTLLSHGWTSRDRNTFPHIKKLFDITGEHDSFEEYKVIEPLATGDTLKSNKNLPHRAKMYKSPMIKRGDKMGSWYHFAGTALNSYLKSINRVNIIPGELDTNTMIFLEEKILFRFNTQFDSKKRVQIDLAGSRFGASLARNMKKYSNLEEFNHTLESRDIEYIYNDENKYKDWALKEGQRPLDFKKNRRTLFKPDDDLDRLKEGLLSKDPVEKYYAIKSISSRQDPKSLILAIEIAKKDPDPVFRFLAGEEYLNRVKNHPKKIDFFFKNIFKNEERVIQVDYLRILYNKNIEIPERFQSIILDSITDPKYAGFTSTILDEINNSEIQRKLILKMLASDNEEIFKLGLSRLNYGTRAIGKEILEDLIANPDQYTHKDLPKRDKKMKILKTKVCPS